MEIVNRHLNVPQIRSAIVNAPFEYAIIGRGTGKSTGLLAPKAAQYMNSMPRTRGTFVASSFQQILTRTFQPIMAGWEQMGYIKDVHYIIGEKPTAKWKKMWNWRGPFTPILEYDYIVSWWNGSVMQMVSQDRKGSSNGLSIDWIQGDEAKLLNHERLTQELFLANRGPIQGITDVNPHHHGITFTSDMPVGTAGRWLLNHENDMDKQKLNAILSLEQKKYDLIQKMHKSKSITVQKNISRVIAKIDAAANMVRKNFVYFHEGSTLENIHVLGVDYIKSLLRNITTDFEFRTAVLNQRPYKLEDGFYPDLDEDKHGYFSYDYHNTFEKHGYNFDLLGQINDCRKDGDVNLDEPLHIGMDYNRRIWPIVTGQVEKVDNDLNELRVISAMDVLYPLQLQDSLVQWSNYYSPMKRKTVYFWYDHTALTETRTTLRDDIINGLRKLGWVVIERYIGKTDNHDVRYRVMSKLLKEDGDTNWRIRINRDNCKYLLLSMYQTQAIEKEKSFAKDKKPERDKNYPAQEAPHYGDAYDTLVLGITHSGQSYSSSGASDNGGIELR